MITLEQFLDTFLGGSWGYPDVNHFKGECLSICKIYIKECFGIEPPPSGTNSAYGYWSNFPNPLGEKFEKVLNTDDLVPEKGWIAIWKPWASNPYGHIAIVADGCTTGTLKNYAQNWTSRTFQLESNRYTNVIGFLKPKSIIQDMISDEQKRILDFLKGKTEGDVREAFGALGDLPKKNEQIITLTNKVHSLQLQTAEIEKQIAKIEAKFIEKEKEVASWQKKLETANTTISDQILKIEELDRLAKDNRNLYLAKNDDFNNLNNIFEEYKKTHPEEVIKFSIISFIKSLFLK